MIKKSNILFKWVAIVCMPLLALFAGCAKLMLSPKVQGAVDQGFAFAIIASNTAGYELAPTLNEIRGETQKFMQSAGDYSAGDVAEFIKEQVVRLAKSPEMHELLLDLLRTGMKHASIALLAGNAEFPAMGTDDIYIPPSAESVFVEEIASGL